jgi:glycosyltransferase involved in cell wall biosynthesis
MQFGGEAALPVHYFRLLRQRQIETWLVVHERTRQELLSQFPEDSDRIYFVPDTIWQQLMDSVSHYLPKKLFEITLGFAMKLLTELAQRSVIRQLINTQQIDLIHQPIFVSPKTPSLIFGMGVPVIMGPLNGGMTYAPAFQQSKRQLVMQVVHLGRGLSDILNLLIPGKRLAATVLVANQRTRDALPRGVRGRIVELVENGVETQLWQPAAVKPPGTPRFVFMGRLVDWKAVDWLLLAFQQVLKQVPAELEIIGDGPLRQQLQQLSEDLGLSEQQVKFSGWLSQQQCAQRLQQSDVLVLPSLFESGGAVVLEAMAVGLPVIATNWGGPVDYLDSTCGILIDPTSKSIFIEQLIAAMLKLAQSPELRQRMGTAGRQRVLNHYDWQHKIDRILEIYREAVNRVRVG